MSIAREHQIKVIYDISVLGQGHLHQRARTGIFRVVESIAENLANSKECDGNQSKISGYSPAAFELCQGFLQAATRGLQYAGSSNPSK